MLCKSGTSGRTRTGTGVTPVDFESTASTNFATLAHKSEGHYTDHPFRVNDFLQGIRYYMPHFL